MKESYNAVIHRFTHVKIENLSLAHNYFSKWSNSIYCIVSILCILWTQIPKLPKKIESIMTEEGPQDKKKAILKKKVNLRVRII